MLRGGIFFAWGNAPVSVPCLWLNVKGLASRRRSFDENRDYRQMRG